MAASGNKIWNYSRMDSPPLRLELPQVVEISLRSGRVEAVPAEEPEIARRIDPARGAESTSGSVRGGGCSQRAVDSGLAAAEADCAAAAHPRPLARVPGCARSVLPQVVEISETSGRVVALPAEEPEVARPIDPAHGAESTSGNVRGGWRSQRAVDSGLAAVVADCAAASHPRPLARLPGRARSIPPQGVEKSEVSSRVEAYPAEDPDIARRIGPAYGGVQSSGNVRRGWHPLRAVDSGLAAVLVRDCAAAAHPCPLARVPGRARSIFPQVVEISLRSDRVGAAPAEEPEIARRIDPAHGAVAASGNVRGGCRSQRAVDSVLAEECAGDCAAAAHPRPLAQCAECRVKLPQVVELSIDSRRLPVDAISAEDPDIGRRIDPAQDLLARSGIVRGRGCSLRPVDSGYTGRTAG